jgi:hypothetical protein
MSFFTRLRDPTLLRLRGEVSYQRVLKYSPDQAREPKGSPGGGRFASGTPGGGGSGEYPVPYEGNYASPTSLPKPGDSPADIDRKLEGAMAELMKEGPHNLEHKIPWTKEKPEGTGINTSGIAKVAGDKYFTKLQRIDEANCEKGAWEAAKALGWTDMARPAAVATRDGDYINDNRRGVVMNPLLPEGESLMTTEEGGNITARVESSDVNVSQDKLERMMVFEYIIGAVDRHGGNYWVDHDTGDLHGIDYARSYMPYSEASEIHGRAGTSEEGGLWDRSFNSNRTVAREHLQKVLDTKDKLMATIPPTGGFRTHPTTAIVAMEARFNAIRLALSIDGGERIDMKAKGIWK